MNYKKIHARLIEKAKGREENEIYTVHHILPRSMGGKDVPENRVLLTPKEHYIIHRLFARLYKKQPEIKFLLDSFSQGMKGVGSPRISNISYYVAQLKMIKNLQNNSKVEKRRKLLQGLLFTEACNILSLPHINPKAIMNMVEFKLE